MSFLFPSLVPAFKSNRWGISDFPALEIEVEGTPPWNDPDTLHTVLVLRPPHCYYCTKSAYNYSHSKQYVVARNAIFLAFCELFFSCLNSESCMAPQHMHVRAKILASMKYEPT